MMKFVKKEGSYFDRPVPAGMDDPHINNLEETAALIRGYIDGHPGCCVTIVGDYDADGINAAAILYWAFAKMGVWPALRLPHRFTEGYGLSEKIIDEIPDGLVVTVDNGIAAYGAVKKAKDKGLCVVVTDHHLPPVGRDGETILPPADIILDPHVEPEKSGFTDYCGAALAYRLAKALFPGSVFKPLLALASIATVADVVPVTGANRTLLKGGLSCINTRKVVPGLDVLLEELGMDSHINEEDYGFRIGPAFNAPGRLYDSGAEDVLKLLTAKKGDYTSRYKARRIIENNEKRKSMVKNSLAVAEKAAGSARPIAIADKSFHEGVIGIIAGQLAEKSNCPAVVFTHTAEPGILKGSGRSVPGIDLKDVLDSIQHLILQYGGHAGAAGLSIREQDFDRFREAFTEACGELPPVQDGIIYYDEELDAGGLEAAAQKMAAYAPFGEGNPQPVFHMVYTTDGEARTIGDGSSIMVKDERLTFMGFGLAEEYEKIGRPACFETVGCLKEHWFRGRKSYQFNMDAVILPEKIT